MDIEKTLELIAASQLQAEKQAKARARESDERAAKHDEWMAEHDKRMAEHDKWMAEHDKQMAKAKQEAEASDAKAKREAEAWDAKAKREAEARARELDDRHAKAMKRMDRADKQIEATRNLVRGGMKMMVTLQKLHKENEYKLNALIDSQMRTDEVMRKSEERFNRLLEKLSFKRSNGHN